MIFYKVYPKALSATLLSIIAGGMIGGGIIIAIGAFSGGQPEGIFFCAALVGVGVLLRKLADKQAERVWHKKGLK